MEEVKIVCTVVRQGDLVVTAMQRGKGIVGNLKKCDLAPLSANITVVL